VFGSISFWRRVPSNSDTTATGPMAISLELPIAAYIRGGTKLLSVKLVIMHTSLINTVAGSDLNYNEETNMYGCTYIVRREVAG
jgi:hypothetical protein